MRHFKDWGKRYWKCPPEPHWKSRNSTGNISTAPLVFDTRYLCLFPVSHIYTYTTYTVPCSTVLLLGGSCGSCLTLRADEDVTEEVTDIPPWRWPLTQNNMKVKADRKEKGERIEEWEREDEKQWAKKETIRMKRMGMKRGKNYIKVNTFVFPGVLASHSIRKVLLLQSQKEVTEASYWVTNSHVNERIATIVSWKKNSSKHIHEVEQSDGCLGFESEGSTCPKRSSKPRFRQWTNT